MSTAYSGDGITFPDSTVQATAPRVGMVNRIINGDMRIDQRNAGASVTPTGTLYTVDRWQATVSTGSKFSVQQNAGSVTPPAGFSKYLGCTSLSAYTVGSGDYFMMRQAVEGFNTSDLAWGTASASPITISFWVRSSLTGTFGGALENNASNRSYAFSYTVSVANTWEKKTVTIGGDTTGTWETGNSIGVYLAFGLGVGSGWSGTAGAWGSTRYFSVTGATSVVGTSGATWYVTGVQLEKGSTATAFDYRPYSTELQLAQRYCWVVAGNGLYYPRQHLDGISSTTGIWYVQYPVVFRALPSFSTKNISSSTIEMSNHTNGVAPILSSVTFGESAFQSGFVNMNAGSGFTAGGTGHWRWIVGPDANFTFSAEL